MIVGEVLKLNMLKILLHLLIFNVTASTYENLMHDSREEALITADVDCVDYYKVSAFVPFKKMIPSNHSNSNVKFTSAVCIPTFANRFCLDEDKSYHWKDYQPCNLIKNSTVIDCPQYRRFLSFKDFSSWTAKTTTVKIRAINRSNGTVVIETKSVVVTPMFRCPDIDMVGPGHSMFNRSGKK